MNWALVNSDTLGSYKEKSRERIRQNYSWDLVTEQDEKLFMEL